MKGPNQLLQDFSAHFPDVKQLRTQQVEALQNILDGKNNLTLIPTGQGKSLIFQLAAIAKGGLNLVISPLVALMNEQVAELKVNGVKAEAINGGMGFPEQRKLYRRLNEECPTLLYVSPERFNNSLFKEALKRLDHKINLLVIDEAHCISQWGGDFRPEYAEIMSFVHFLKLQDHNPTICAFTATLSPRHKGDILDEFKIDKSATVVHPNMLRSDLDLSVLEFDNEKEKVAYTDTFLELHKCEKVVLYLYSKHQCEKLAEEFSNRYTTDYYHSGRKGEEKDDVFERFKSGEIRLLFATSAFGMGINVKDIDGIVHIHIPYSPEEYYQQVGRGARDEELRCNCLMMWTPTNFDRREREIKQEKISVEMLHEAYALLGYKNKKDEVATMNIKAYQESGNYNLPLINLELKHHGVVEEIAQMNGTPQKVVLKGKDELWDKFKSSTPIDSFEIAADFSEIPLNTIIPHLINLEMDGKVEKLTALDKKIYTKVKHNEVPQDIAEQIVKDINNNIDEKLKQLDKLKEMCESGNNPTGFLNEYLVAG